MSASTHEHHQASSELLALLESICQTPAPTFDEAERGALVAALLAEAGLKPHKDEAGNITAEVPGGEGPRVLVAAHLDTVFERDTDLTIRREPGRLSAPGIGDNSASLAVLTRFVMKREGPRPRLTYAATVGEEGLGDLCGMRHLMKTRRADFDLAVAIDGHLGTVVNRSVGSRRYSLRFKARGGHSWGDFPSPSAIHALGEAIHALNGMKVPSEPRSSYNVGLVSGGTSVNAIAQEAELILDLRSLDAPTLAALERRALTLVRRAAERERGLLDAELVGDRPADYVDNDPLVRAAVRGLERVKLEARLAASSTDANAAMAAGLAAVTFGVYRGGDAHRLSEWLEPESLLVGYRALEGFMAELAKL
ncbi:MAG: M20/M25/M40 family metallo-hydrolase [Deinococcota bacterium]|nr:M20/M25/M40 family metallo-hydrolase [Deinococcota bacterium]